MIFMIYKRTLFVFFSVILFSQLKSVTCTFTALNGDWDIATNWSCGAVPGCGDEIIIPAGATASILTQQDYEGCAPAVTNMTISGTLYFQSGNKLKLPCGSSITLMPGGAVISGGGGGNSNNIQICGVVMWNTAAGPITGPCVMPPGGCEPLPIELASFTATASGSQIELLWTTLTEKNNSKFEVERGNDAINFELISTLPSKANGGNSMLPLNYSYLDKNLVSNTNYYRLKQIDFDGSFAFSKLISVSNIKDKHIKFIIYPNPNHGEFTADISGVENNHNITILLTDNTGKLVYKSSLYIQDSQHTTVQIVPEEKIADGIYFCTLMVEEIAFKVKVVVN